MLKLVNYLIELGVDLFVNLNTSYMSKENTAIISELNFMQELGTEIFIFENPIRASNIHTISR